MTLLRLLATSSSAPEPAPGPPGINSPTAAVVDWTNATTLVLLNQIPGAVSLREQDDIVHDPTDPAAPFKCYFTAAFNVTPDLDSRTYLVTSTNRITWSAPIPCTIAGGGSLIGQDPSITQTFRQGPPVAYRGGGKLWMLLERNAPHSSVDLYSSTNGTVWTLEKQPAIPRGAAGQWDSALTGSPVARHDGTRFIMGYEGINGLDEAFGIAYGADPLNLTKLAANPVITGPTLGAVGTTAFCDAMWVTPDATKVMLTGHPGYASGLTMFRAYTTKLDPLTWTSSDFTYLGAAGPGREDLSVDVSANRVVTAPPDDLSLISAPLI